jgi:MarR family transcriptional regulator, organic hydroperoxide resistance regulator
MRQRNVPLSTLMRELSALSAELCRALDRRLRAECGMSLASFQIMRAVGSHGQAALADLVDGALVPAGNVTELVRVMETAGYCTMRPTPDPSLDTVVELTPYGAEIARDAAAAFDDELELRLGSAVPAPELRRFSTVLSWLGQSADLRGGGSLAAQPSEGIQFGGDPRCLGSAELLEDR